VRRIERIRARGSAEEGRLFQDRNHLTVGHTRPRTLKQAAVTDFRMSAFRSCASALPLAADVH
jgi:hypothetical protein